MTDIPHIAEIVDTAAHDATEISQLSLSGYDLTPQQAYDVQAESIDRRMKRGETLIGVKMGMTSRAKMIQMGLDEMMWGRLTDKMLVEDGGEIDLKDYVHPRVEPEIAFLMKQDLSGKVSPLQAVEAVSAIAPAIEIIDSRYKDFKFNVPDVIADNTSSSSLVVGPWAKPDINIANLGMVMEFDGKAVEIGSSAAILGHPARALAGASRLVAEQGLSLKAGWIVMAGGATAAVALKPGVQVRLSVAQLGRVNFSVLP